MLLDWKDVLNLRQVCLVQESITYPLTELLRRANTFRKQRGQNLYGSTSSMSLMCPILGRHYALSAPWSSTLPKSSNVWLCGEQA